MEEEISFPDADDDSDTDSTEGEEASPSAPEGPPTHIIPRLPENGEDEGAGPEGEEDGPEVRGACAA